MGSQLPYRIDLMDDEVDSIRTFDAETQRSITRGTDVRLLPGREFPLTPESIAYFRSQWRAHFEGDPTACPIYRDVSQSLAPAGIEYYLKLFFERTATLFDFLREDTLVVHRHWRFYISNRKIDYDRVGILSSANAYAVTATTTGRKQNRTEHGRKS